MSDIECPYCDADIEICHDDGAGYAEDELHQQTCGSCDKTFTFTTAISFDYSARKADCLNGGAHDYHKTATIPAKYARLRCGMCGDERPIDQVQKEPSNA